MKYTLNTSNPNKLREFRELGLQGLKATRIDMPEPNSDPLTVIRYKASMAGPYVIVEDTSFDVEGVDIGVNIRWLIGTLDQHVGKRATFRVLLGVLEEGLVYVYEGVVKGKLVEPRGKGFGFDPFFLPEKARYTLGESKPPQFNARAKAIRNFKARKPLMKLKPLKKWEGEFQH